MSITAYKVEAVGHDRTGEDYGYVNIMYRYRDLTGTEGKIDATHGGLECGLFIEKIPGLDAISLGPELHDVHSVRERLSVPSTERVYELVCEVLRRSR